MDREYTVWLCKSKGGKSISFDKEEKVAVNIHTSSTIRTKSVPIFYMLRTHSGAECAHELERKCKWRNRQYPPEASAADSQVLPPVKLHKNSAGLSQNIKHLMYPLFSLRLNFMKARSRESGVVKVFMGILLSAFPVSLGMAKSKLFPGYFPDFNVEWRRRW